VGCSSSIETGLRTSSAIEGRLDPSGSAGPVAAWPAMNVGDVARRTRTITARDIELFTEMTGDRNPLHYDERAASASRFGGIIVQGGVTSGLLNALVAEDLPGPGSVFLHVDWSFRAAVQPGDEITAEAEVIEVRADKPICRLRTTITNQDGTTVLDGTALVYREPLDA
jgi:acyl dehydratase